MKYVKNIKEINDFLKLETKHPFIDIRRYKDIVPLFPINMEPTIFGFYKISFVKNFNGYIEIGNIKLSGNNGILYFLSPEQQYSCNSTNPWDGYQILIHQDIFRKHLFDKSIDSYNFFSYDVNESLLLTEEEESRVIFLMNEMWNEFDKRNDEFSISIILSYLSVLLNISERFYSRQFKSHKTICNQIVNDFLKLLKTHYSNTTIESEQPTVFYFSKMLNITPNYLGDTIKYYTGKSALSLIHEQIIKEAKILLRSSNKTVSEISYILGFEYPTYFSRLFKKKTNFSPTDFRNNSF